MRQPFSTFGRLATLLVAGGTVLLAQGTQTSGLTATIVDRDGRPVLGAQVRLASPSLQGERILVSDESGRAVARLLPPGQYRITVSKAGFQTAVLNERLGLEQTFSPKVTLASEAGVVVEVTASNAATDKAKVEASTNFSLKDIEQLPTIRSKVQDIILLAPGVTDGVNGPQVRGSQSTGNLYLVDGVNYADNSYAFPRINLLFDAIEETQVITGAISAEYGDVDGGVINSITKSGSNEFTGQVRWDLSNPAWNARRPFEDPADNLLSEEKTYSAGGYFIKDRLWFHASYFQKEGGPSRTLGGQAAIGIGPSAYVESAKDIRKNIKVTWAVTPDHTLVGSYFAQQKSEVHDYGVGDLSALNTRTEASKIYSLQLRSIFGQHVAFSARLGAKRWQVVVGGGDPGGTPPILNYDDFLIYNNAIFDGTPTDRDMDTANAKLSLFWNGAGSHETDLGLDLYRGTVQGMGGQSLFSWNINGRMQQVWVDVTNLDLQAQTATPNSISTFFGVAGAKARVFSEGLYVNDKWTVNGHLNVQLGLRYDRFRGEDEQGRETVQGSGLAPRLGLKYDLIGDATWVFGLSYGRYNQRPLDVVLNRNTYADNPGEIDYAAVSTLPAVVPLATLFNPASYDTTAIVFYADPKLNTLIDPNLKPQHTDEIQASATHTFRWGERTGFLRATFVSKKWRDIIDTTTGDDGTLVDPSGSLVYNVRTYNNPLARRDYRGLELDGNLGSKIWSLGGSITWSRLEGNFVGEATSRPGIGSLLATFSSVGGVRMFEPETVSPYGPLQTDNPLRMRLNATYTTTGVLGVTTWALLYRFDSGQRLSATRQVPRALLNPALPSQFGQTWAQYQDNRRGTIIMPSTAFLDLAINHEVALTEARLQGQERPVMAFFRVAVQNLFNHQQPSNLGAYNVLFEGETGSLSAPFVRDGSYGSNGNASYWAPPRTYTLSAGVRF